MFVALKASIQEGHAYNKEARQFLETYSGPIDSFYELPYRTFEEELRLGLQKAAPAPTKHGVNGSFFLSDSGGRRAAIFKPMNMEAGAPKNHRLAASSNIQFRDSILPGQGAGNEVLAYELDKQAFGGRYEIPKTILVRLRHEAFEGEELGSAQQFVPDARSLSELHALEIDAISQKEWEKLNFRLISGSTDAHMGNILVSEGKLFLIDSGDDFVGPEGQHQYYDPWTTHPKAHRLLSQQEYNFLHNIDIKKTMHVFEQTALSNEQTSPVLKVSKDKYLTQVTRLYLAKLVGKYRLTQAEWFDIMTPKRGLNGKIYPGQLETIYNKHVGDWLKIHDALEIAVLEQLKKREKTAYEAHPAFHV
ncbi:MAG: hypothetical protein WCK49_02440 [Myxococcaceae bacterium]